MAAFGLTTSKCVLYNADTAGGIERIEFSNYRAVQNESDFHTGIEARVRAINALVDHLGDVIETNRATIRQAKALSERIQILRQQIAERKHVALLRGPSFGETSLSARANGNSALKLLAKDRVS